MTDDNIRQIWSDAELDAALADLHSDPGPDDGLAFARTSLLAAAGAPLEEEVPEPRKSRGSWRWIAVAAAVTALTGGLVVATQIGNQAPAPIAPAATAPGLDQLRGVDLPVGPGEYRHTTTSSWSVSDRGPYGEPTAYVGTQTELWIPADPAGFWHLRSWVSTTLAGLTVPSPQQNPPPVHTTDESGPGGMYPEVQEHYRGQNFQGSWDTPTAPFVAALPADVQVLLDRLVNNQSSMANALHPGTPNDAGSSIQMVREVLSLGLVRGEVRVALWQALARVPGIVTTPGTAAPDGRVGIGFTATTGVTLIADPATAQLIGYTLPPKAVGPPVSASPGTTSQSTPMTTPHPQTPVQSTEKNALEEVYTYSISKTNS